jgi:flagellar hook-associated protein 1 FlgK
MSLTTAINTAQTSLSNTSTQTNIVSRNIANAANPDYNRRNAALSTNVYGAQVVAIQRAQDQALFQQSIKGTSSAAGQQSLLTGLDRSQEHLRGQRLRNLARGTARNAARYPVDLCSPAG